MLTASKEDYKHCKTVNSNCKDELVAPAHAAYRGLYSQSKSAYRPLSAIEEREVGSQAAVLGLLTLQDGTKIPDLHFLHISI